MLHAQDVERLNEYVAGLDRPALIEQFEKARSPFPLDFSESFLASLEIDRLRHLLFALCLTARRLPEGMASEVAIEPAPMKRTA